MAAQHDHSQGHDDHGQGHGHGHHHHPLPSNHGKAFALAVTLNALFVVAEAAASFISGSTARIAAALPAPKRREVADPSGFTRRHGNVIAARSGVVRNEAMDACVYE